MATALKLAFSLVFGLLTFVLPLPIGGERLFGEWGRAGLLLGLLLGLVVSFAPFESVPIFERILRSSRGKQMALAFAVAAIVSVGGYLLMRSAVRVPEGVLLWVEILLYGAANLLMAFLLAVAGTFVATALLKWRN